VSWFDRSAAALEAGFAGLPADAWTHEIVTAQGRSVPASEAPWMRSREVMVHAVDLDAGLTLADLPSDFLAALGTDIAGKRAASGGPALAIEATDRLRRRGRLHDLRQLVRLGRLQPADHIVGEQRPLPVIARIVRRVQPPVRRQMLTQLRLELHLVVLAHLSSPLIDFPRPDRTPARSAPTIR
jgi:Mycothiol maleylpyruvate isomerase N-terminal domain